MSLALLIPLLSAQGILTDTFDNFSNPSGWTFAPWEVLEATGGNPNGWLHISDLDTVYPILSSGPGAPSPWLGDLAAHGVLRISLDAITISTDFPVAGGFQLSLLLRDDKGTPFDPNDDDYAYAVGPEIPLPGNGWKHFDFVVPSRSAVSPPPGWRGGWAGDGAHFRPGVAWQDLIAGVTQVEVWWSDPTRFAIFQRWQVGVDNLEVEWAPALTLLPPAPGAAGIVNQFSAANAAPGETVAFAGSLVGGSASASCGGDRFVTGLSAPRALGAAAAGAAGVATVQAMVPASLSGATVRLQALNRDRCEPSAPLAVNFL